jgi:hypothetical protein
VRAGVQPARWKCDDRMKICHAVVHIAVRRRTASGDSAGVVHATGERLGGPKILMVRYYCLCRYKDDRTDRRRASAARNGLAISFERFCTRAVKDTAAVYRGPLQRHVAFRYADPLADNCVWQGPEAIRQGSEHMQREIAHAHKRWPGTTASDARPAQSHCFSRAQQMQRPVRLNSTSKCAHGTMITSVNT